MIVVLSGVNVHVRATLEKAGFIKKLGEENVCSHINFALKRAEEIVSC